MDFLHQLHVFIAVVDNGSFTRASESLRMGRPAVTNAINALESHVGARLLQRTTRKTNLTSEGELFYSHATALLNNVAVTENLFGGSEKKPSGRLRIDVPVAIAKPIIVPALPAFRAEYPDVDIILGVSDQPVDLVADGIDCVLRIGDLTQNSMIARKLASMKMIVCAAPSYLTEHGTPRSIFELKHHLAVNYFSGRGHRSISWTVNGDINCSDITLRSAIMVNDTEAFVACAISGMGLIQVPGLFVAEHLSSGALVQILPDSLYADNLLSLMYPNRQYLSPQVRAFIDWVSNIIAKMRSPWLKI